MLTRKVKIGMLLGLSVALLAGVGCGPGRATKRRKKVRVPCPCLFIPADGVYLLHAKAPMDGGPLSSPPGKFVGTGSVCP